MTTPDPDAFPESPPPEPEAGVTVGRVVGVHGMRGDIKVEPLTDFPQRFERGAVLWLAGDPRHVERSRRQGRLVYLKLQGIDSRTAAESCTGEELTVPEAHAIAEEGVYYQHDLIGLRVLSEDGETLGRLADILSTGANDVYVVRGDRGELLLPAIDDVVKQIDPRAGCIVVDLLPGLEFRPPAKAQRRRTGS